jgi:hypothetical protein
VSANAFTAVVEAMQALLKNRSGLQDVFVGPLDDSGAREADLVLFLYRITVDAELRNVGHELPATQGANAAANLIEGAMPLQLHFLLTAGNRDTGGELAALGKLGRAIQIFNDTSVISGPSLGPDPVHISFDPLSSEELSRIWSLFPTVNFRTSVAYLATPVWIDPASMEEPAPRVVDDRHGYRARAL